MAAERDGFFDLADDLIGHAADGEVILLGLKDESSDFVRYNASRVRQAGSVAQSRLRLTLVKDGRQAHALFDLCGDARTDRERGKAALDNLRGQCALLPQDPYVHLATERNDTERTDPGRLPDAVGACAAIAEAFDGLDMTGIFASGTTFAGFASSFGQRNWHSVSSYNFDYSVHKGSRSLKQSLAGPVFDAEALQRETERARRTLALLSRPSTALKPGRYRAYFAPDALAEILGLVAWGGFGLKSYRTGRSPLQRLQNGAARLDPRVALEEDNAAGFAPGFTAEGFIKPGRVPLVESGAFGGFLVDARSAREFGATVNAGVEAPLSLRMAPGGLAEKEVYDAIDTGLYVANVWYCNFSDRNACRITGMTRFACLWVKDGAPQGPLEPMRFDDSLFGLLGDRLADLTDSPRLMLDPDTYEGRSFASACLPGALVAGLDLAL